MGDSKTRLIAGGALGEVQETPTAYTLLDRLKSIYDIIRGRTGGVISTVNSTSTPLGANATWIGQPEDITHYAMLSVFVWTSHASAVDGLSLEFSIDGLNWDDQDQYTIPAGKGKFFTAPREAQFFRVVYTNGPTPQTGFRLQTMYQYTYAKPSSHRIMVDLTDDEDAELVRAIVSGRKPDGSYGNIAFDAQGRLVVAAASASVAIKGFADGQITVSTTAPTAIRNTAYIEQTVNAQRSLVSNNAADTAAGAGARSVRITYYDQNMMGPYTETVTLNGTTPVNTVNTNICFVESMRVLTVGTAGGANQGIISLKAAVAGGGTTIGSIAVGDNKTFWTHHYVAPGRTCSITGFLLGIKGSDVCNGFLRAVNPLSADSAEIQVSDTVRTPNSGQAFRSYETPVQVAGPARVTGYVISDGAGPRTFYGSFDFYEE